MVESKDFFSLALLPQNSNIHFCFYSLSSKSRLVHPLCIFLRISLSPVGVGLQFFRFVLISLGCLAKKNTLERLFVLVEWSDKLG
jgi:hypothetical protein